jgi:hypothetical protein
MTETAPVHTDDVTVSIGAVLPDVDVVTVMRSLGRRSANALGFWRLLPSRWELWTDREDHPGDPMLLGRLDVAHDAPRRHYATLLRGTVTGAGRQIGLDVETLCDLALMPTERRIADCERLIVNGPPVLKAVRVGWTEQMQAMSEIEQAWRVSRPVNSPRPLDAGEDSELRRLHFLARFGGLTADLVDRYDELRSRDRRTYVRDPDEVGDVGGVDAMAVAEATTDQRLSAIRDAVCN